MAENEGRTGTGSTRDYAEDISRYTRQPSPDVNDVSRYTRDYASKTSEFDLLAELPTSRLKTTRRTVGSRVERNRSRRGRK